MVNALDSKASSCKKSFHPSTFDLNWLDKIDNIEDFRLFTIFDTKYDSDIVDTGFKNILKLSKKWES